MKKIALAFVALYIIFSLCSCGSKETSKQSAVNSSSQSSYGRQETANQSEDKSLNLSSSASQEMANLSSDNSLSQYITYNLPNTLVNGSYNRELGYLGGNLFCLKDTGSCVAKKASDSTPYGWNSYGGVEMYYKLNCKFNNEQLTDVSLPWNHSAYLTKAQHVDKCEVSAVIVQVSHDLYTAPEAQANNIDNDKRTSSMWYVFFAKENSDICYAIFLNTDYFSKEDTILLAQSVKFKDNAFNIEIK